MSIIKVKDRTGKDLLEFMERASLDAKLAEVWAIEKFILIDGNNLNLANIVKLNDNAYIRIVSRIFPMSGFDNIYEDNLGIHFGDICVKEKKLSRDFLTELQTNTLKSKGSDIALVKYCISHFYEISLDEIEKSSYELAAYLLGRVNNFLKEFATPRNEFEINDVWSEDAEKVKS